MTTINIYGRLAKKFGSQIKLHLGKINDFINAVDSIKNGFRKELINLYNNGYGYIHSVDKKIINLVPSICGSGGNVWLAIALIVVAIIIVVLTAGTAAAGVGMLFGYAGAGATAGAIALASLTGALFLTGVSMLISMALTPSPEAPKQQEGETGGSTSTIDAQTRSFIFNNNENIATQGALIALGYGRLRVASKIINVSVKNYSTNQNYKNEFSQNQSLQTDIYD